MDTAEDPNNVIPNSVTCSRNDHRNEQITKYNELKQNFKVCVTTMNNLVRPKIIETQQSLNNNTFIINGKK